MSTLRPRVPRPSLPAHSAEDDADGLTHDQLVEALRSIDGLVDVGTSHPNFQFRDRPFLHFHDGADGTYADVRLGGGDFAPHWASTAAERAALLDLVERHVRKVGRTRKDDDRTRRRRR